MEQPIQYVPQKEIDKSRWDQCIEQAANGRVYGYSYYLDCMALNWDALIWGDYEAVMPLTWKKKYGIAYLYQPFLTAQLGIFGKMVPGLTKKFISAIPSRFRLTEIALNSTNTISESDPSFTQRNNFILPLDQTYEILQSRYQENTRRNCKKALQDSCTVEKGFDADQVIALALEQMQQYDRQSAAYVDQFRALYRILLEKKMATTYGVKREGQLLASCCFFFSHQRAYYILVGNHPQSRQTGASHALLDGFIRDQAGTGIILDFEGSDLPGLAAFYSSFGAVNEPYPFLKMNRLPFYLRWLKK